jgi:hypothetical protein
MRLMIFILSELLHPKNVARRDDFEQLTENTWVAGSARARNK